MMVTPMEEPKSHLKPTAWLLILVTSIGRLIPHLPNMTPMNGTALFGGSKLNRPWNYFLPIGIMLATDYFLGFHKTIIYVYVSFLISVFLGERFLANNQSAFKLSVIAISSSIIFFIITNFGVWQAGGLYPHTLAGLIDSYIMGLPFLGNMAVGDVVFTVGFFKLYELAENRGVVRVVDQHVINTLHN